MDKHRRVFRSHVVSVSSAEAMGAAAGYSGEQQLQGCAKTAPTNSTSVGSAVFISEGVYFIRGQFVRVEDETLILDPHDADPTCRVGLEITEEIVTSSKDQSLTDNAKGFNNFAAPGADRLKVTLTLAKTDATAANVNFIQICNLLQGNIIKEPSKEQNWAWLYEILAKRTNDESGRHDHSVRVHNRGGSK